MSEGYVGAGEEGLDGFAGLHADGVLGVVHAREEQRVEAAELELVQRGPQRLDELPQEVRRGEPQVRGPVVFEVVLERGDDFGVLLVQRGGVDERFGEELREDEDGSLAGLDAGLARAPEQRLHEDFLDDFCGVCSDGSFDIVCVEHELEQQQHVEAQLGVFVGLGAAGQHVEHHLEVLRQLRHAKLRLPCSAGRPPRT